MSAGRVLDRVLSHDPPRSRWLALLLLLIVVGLAVAPFAFPGAKALSVAMVAFILWAEASPVLPFIYTVF